MDAFVALIVLFVLWVVWYATRLARLDAAQIRAERDERRSASRLYPDVPLERRAVSSNGYRCPNCGAVASAFPCQLCGHPQT